MGTPVNVKIQNKAVRIDFLIIFQFTIRKHLNVVNEILYGTWNLLVPIFAITP